MSAWQYSGVAYSRIGGIALLAAIGLGAGAATTTAVYAGVPTSLILLISGAIGLLPIALRSPQVFVYLGIFLISSDRFLVQEIRGLTVRPSLLLFAFALVGLLLATPPTATAQRRSRIPPPFIIAISGLLALHMISGIRAGEVLLAARQGLIEYTGMVVPLAALLLGLNSVVRVREAVAIFVLSQVIFAIFGLYQLVAFQTGLPQGITYEATLHDLGRITSVTSEPAYYAAFACLGLPLLLSDALTGTKRTFLPPVFVLGVVLLAIVLSNARVAYLSVPLLVGATVAFHWRDKLHSEAAMRLMAGLLSIALFLLTLAVVSGFSVPGYLSRTYQSIGNTSSDYSNVSRLNQYELTVDIAEDNLLLGVGPGRLREEMSARGWVFGDSGESATANNIWLTEIAHKGIFSVLFVAIIFYGAIKPLMQRGTPRTVAMLSLGIAFFLLINGSLVALLWDIKLWTVLGLCWAYRQFASETRAISDEGTSPG